jgi:hypothetical protein
MKTKNLEEMFNEAADPLRAKEVINKNIAHKQPYSNVRVLKVWPKPGNRFVFLYEVENRGKNGWAVVYLFPQGFEYTKGECPKNGTNIVDWNGFVQCFPDDFRMPHLRIAVKPERAKPHIIPVLDQAGTCWAGFNIESVQPRGYWPGKRCQIEYYGRHPQNGNNKFFAKVYREGNGLEVIPIHESLQKAGFNGKYGMLTPRPIGYCPELRAVLMEPSKGKRVCEILDEPIAAEAINHAGRLIAYLHKTVLPFSNPPYQAENEIKLIDGWGEVLNLIFSEEAMTMRCLLEELTRLSDVANRPLRSSHRDFHDNQLLYDGKVMTILDLDTTCPAPAELDVGNFFGHLSLRGIQSQGDPEKYAELEGIFLQAYRKTGETINNEAIFWFKAATLLRLASLYMVQPNGSSYFEYLIHEATNLLSELKKEL